MNDQIITVVKHLLRGRFAAVGEIRKKQTTFYVTLPDEIKKVADRWLGQGRNDRDGRATLAAWLINNEPALTVKIETDGSVALFGGGSCAATTERLAHRLDHNK